MAWNTVESRTGTVEAAGLRVSGVIRDTRIGFTGRRGGVAAAYARPARLEVDGPDGSFIVAIPDVQLRIILVVTLLPALYLILRRRRSS